MEAAGQGLVETASDTSSLELGSDTTPSSPTSSQEFLDGIESGSDEFPDGIAFVELGSDDTPSSPTSSQELLTQELLRVREEREVLRARVEFLAHRTLITSEVINVLGVNKDKLEEIRDVRRSLAFLPRPCVTPPEEDVIKWMEIGLESKILLNTPEGSRGGDWIIYVFIGDNGIYGMGCTLPQIPLGHQEHGFFRSPADALTTLSVFLDKVLSGPDPGGLQKVSFYIQNIHQATPMIQYLPGIFQGDLKLDVASNIKDVVVLEDLSAIKMTVDCMNSRIFSSDFGVRYRSQEHRDLVRDLSLVAVLSHLAARVPLRRAQRRQQERRERRE